MPSDVLDIIRDLSPAERSLWELLPGPVHPGIQSAFERAGRATPRKGGWPEQRRSFAGTPYVAHVPKRGPRIKTVSKGRRLQGWQIWRTINRMKKREAQWVEVGMATTG